MNRGKISHLLNVCSMNLIIIIYCLDVLLLITVRLFICYLSKVQAQDVQFLSLNLIYDHSFIIIFLLIYSVAFTSTSSSLSANITCVIWCSEDLIFNPCIFYVQTFVSCLYSSMLIFLSLVSLSDLSVFIYYPIYHRANDGLYLIFFSVIILISIIFPLYLKALLIFLGYHRFSYVIV